MFHLVSGKISLLHQLLTILVLTQAGSPTLWTQRYHLPHSAHRLLQRHSAIRCPVLKQQRSAALTVEALVSQQENTYECSTQSTPTYNFSIGTITARNSRVVKKRLYKCTIYVYFNLKSYENPVIHMGNQQGLIFQLSHPQHRASASCCSWGCEPASRGCANTQLFGSKHRRRVGTEGSWLCE